jgi:hypothetical protein
VPDLARGNRCFVSFPVCLAAYAANSHTLTLTKNGMPHDRLVEGSASRTLLEHRVELLDGFIQVTMLQLETRQVESRLAGRSVE